MGRAGEIAAVLGDVKTARKCFDYCKAKGEYVWAGKIAAMLGDKIAAEEIIMEFQIHLKTHHIEMMISLLAACDLEGACQIMEDLGNQGYDKGSLVAEILQTMNRLQKA